MNMIPFTRSLDTSILIAATCLTLGVGGPLAAQDGPFPPDAWPGSADGEKLVHFTTVDFSLDPLGSGWDETLTILSGGDQTTEFITIGGLEAVKVTGEYLNVSDFGYEDWAEHDTIDVLVQVFGNEAVLGGGGNPRDYNFLTGTLPELNAPLGGSIPVEGRNGQWNWVLFRVANDERPSGEGRFVGIVPDGAQGAIDAGGVNGGTIRVQNVPGWIVHAVAFGEVGAFGEPDQVNRFFEGEECAAEPETNHAFVDINSGESSHMEVLSGGDQVSTITDGIGPEGDKRRAVKADGDFLNFGVTDEYLGATCSTPRAVKVCIEYYDDPALTGALFGPEAYATDDKGGIAFFGLDNLRPTTGTGEWVRQSYLVSSVSLFGVNTAPLTGGPRLFFDFSSDVYISRFDLAIQRVGDHPLAGLDPLEDCFEDPAVCAGEYGFFAEMDLGKAVFNGLAQGTSGGDQEMVEEEAGPADDRRDSLRAAHDDGTPGFGHIYINLAITDEAFGPSSQPNARLAVCVTYWDNPDLQGAVFRPEAYRSVRDGTEGFAFMPESANVVIEGTDRWREAYFEIPDVKFSGVNQGPQAAARFFASDKIHFTRVRYGVIRDCGPTADINPLEECKPTTQGPFPPDAWPGSADGGQLAHFTSVNSALSGLGAGWAETLTILSGGDQQTEPVNIGGRDALRVTGSNLNIADNGFPVWADHEMIDVLMQVYGNDAVLGADGNPRNYNFLEGTLPELTAPVGGQIPVEGKNSQWNWVLFRITNDQRPSGGGRHVGFVPADAQGAIEAGGVNGGTIRVEGVPGIIVASVAFGEVGAFGEPEQINVFFEGEDCAPEPITNHVFIDINSGVSEHMEVLSGGDQISTIADDIGPEGDKRRAVTAEGTLLNFAVTDDFLGADCSTPRAVKICIEYYDDPALSGSAFGPEAYATDNKGGIAFYNAGNWPTTRGTGQWVRQAYVVPAVSLFGVNTAPLTAGPRISLNAKIFISRFDLAVMRVGDHPLAGLDPLEDCFEDPAVCAGEYGFYAEMDLGLGVFDGLAQGTSGGDQEMVEEEAGPAGDRRTALRAAHDDGTAGFPHVNINLAITDEVFGPSSQPNARLAICVTYWDNPALQGAVLRPEAYRSVRNGVEDFAFMPESIGVTLEGTDTWREAYFAIPDIRFSGVNQGPQAAARFVTSDKIHFTRVRYGVIRDCGPTTDINPLEQCKPQIIIAPAAGGMVRMAWPSNTNNWVLEESADIMVWDLSTEVPVVEGDENVVEVPATAPDRHFRLRQ